MSLKSEEEKKNKIYIKKIENFIAFILISFMCELFAK